MFVRRLTYWLALALLVGAGGCELNPQPDLPGGVSAHDPSGPVLGGGAASSGGSNAETPPGTAGSLNLGGGPVNGAGGSRSDSGNGAGEGPDPSDAGGAAAGGEGGQTGEAGESAGGAAP